MLCYIIALAQIGDVVREVNAIRGDIKAMLSELRKALVLSLKLEHCSRSVPELVRSSISIYINHILII